MATTTPRIGLTKPDGTDLVDIAVLNTNFDKIDSNIASTKIQSTKPTTANAGDLWWDSDTGTLYLYYVDANSSQWVAATSDPINIGVVANQTERDAQYPTPAQGMSVYRTDLGVTQRYYGLFNASTNPGGRNTAGWYNTEKSIGLVPIQPTSVVTASGTATATSLGKVTFSNSSAVRLNGIFSADYQSYKIMIPRLTFSTVGSNIYGRLSVNGVDNTSSIHDTHGWVQAGTTLSAHYLSLSTVFSFGAIASDGMVIIELNNPATTYRTSGMFTTSGYSSSVNGYGGALLHDTFIAFDGFYLSPSAGTMSGEIQVFGYNEK